jgi:hypothetical protein
MRRMVWLAGTLVLSMGYVWAANAVDDRARATPVDEQSDESRRQDEMNQERRLQEQNQEERNSENLRQEQSQEERNRENTR